LGQTGADEQGQTPQAFGRDDGPAWGGFRVADERLQRLAERQIGIAAAHLGVAVAHHRQQVGVSDLAAARQLDGQRGLSAARLARHKAHLAAAGQRLGQGIFEPRQLLCAAYEKGAIHGLIPLDATRLTW
jgi:hypothetical protein